MLSWRKVTILLPLNPQEASGPYKEVQESLFFLFTISPFSVGPLPQTEAGKTLRSAHPHKLPCSHLRDMYSRVQIQTHESQPFQHSQGWPPSQREAR